MKSKMIFRPGQKRAVAYCMGDDPFEDSKGMSPQDHARHQELSARHKASNRRRFRRQR